MVTRMMTLRMVASTQREKSNAANMPPDVTISLSKYAVRFILSHSFVFKMSIRFATSTKTAHQSFKGDNV